MAGIPGTGPAIAVANDAAAWFDIAMRAFGWFTQIRDRIRARREAGEQLTPEEQEVADTTDEQAFAKLKADSLRLIDTAEKIRDKHQAVIDEENNAAQSVGGVQTGTDTR